MAVQNICQHVDKMCKRCFSVREGEQKTRATATQTINGLERQGQ